MGSPPLPPCRHSGMLVVVLLICAQVIFLHPHKSSALRNGDFVLGRHWFSGRSSVRSSPMVPERGDMSAHEGGSRTVPCKVKYDPNRSEKRRIPRGSDPIHNRC
ncbi:hypothetical protein MLD38_026171 [Melastoma candidum]|uniref:Uncharacterized protein n=1 Tax=Melastoma candidum TaxID=119954 RepID=A0ACB9P2V8_9MYRT|nr:hypothetical protein MLD38_026171 [Melastoma candidum]